MAERIRLSRARGWRLPEGAVNVARPGKWGNPFVVGKDGTRLQCAAMFAVLAGGFIDCGGRVEVDDQMATWRQLRRVASLKGKDLACWCPLDGDACHADVLLHLANGTARPAWMCQPIDLARVRLGMSATDIAKADKKKAAPLPGNIDRSEG